MKIFKRIGLFTLIILSVFSCKNPSQSQKKDNEPNSNDSIRRIGKMVNNDSIKKSFEVKNYDYIVETNDWYNDVNNNSKQLKLVKNNGKIGLLNGDEIELFPCILDSIVDVENSGYTMINGQTGPTKKGYFTSSYNNNRYAKVKKEGKWGLITIEGNVAIPLIYDEIYDFDYTKTSRMAGPYLDFLDYNGKIAVVRNNDKWGLVNTRGELLTDFIYEKFFIPDVILFFENRVAAKKEGKWGFLNEKGNPVSSFIYDSVGSTRLGNSHFISTYNGGMANVKKKEKWGAIDIDGKEKIPFVYDYISSFTKDIAVVQKDGKWGYINKSGIEIIPTIYDDIKWFEMDLCLVKKDGLWGFLNKKNELIAPLMYNDVLISNEISVDGGLWYFSQDNYCAVKKNGKWGLIDNRNNIVVNFEFDSIKFTSAGLDDWRYFSNGFLAVKKGKFWSVFNKSGLNNIPFEYDDVEIWSEGKVCVKKNEKWGLLDSLGKLIVPIVHKTAMEAGNFNYKTKNN